MAYAKLPSPSLRYETHSRRHKREGWLVLSLSTTEMKMIEISRGAFPAARAVILTPGTPEEPKEQKKCILEYVQETKKCMSTRAYIAH
jgi:hypothetical protein